MPVIIPIGVTVQVVLVFVLIIVANRQIKRIFEAVDDMKRDVEEMKQMVRARTRQ